jgi:hypothetical protein
VPDTAGCGAVDSCLCMLDTLKDDAHGKGGISGFKLLL